MSDEINEKVINIFSKHIKNKPANTPEKVKTFAGFSYVRMDKDANGYAFKEDGWGEQLISGSSQANGNTVTINGGNIFRGKLGGLLMFRNNELSGSIIEIDKFLPKSII